MLGPDSKINGFKPNECLVLDTDTTGITKADEILRICGVDGFGRGVINQYIKPSAKDSWAEAEAIHHITPAMVADAPKFLDIKDRMKFFTRRYPLIIGYKIPFDLKMLYQSGLDLSEHKVLDIAPLFAREINRGKTCKLEYAAQYFNYKPYNDGYDSVRSVLWILEWLMYNAAKDGRALIV